METEWEESARITLEELEMIKACSANKSPGIDGVPYSVLKKVIEADGENFLAMINNTIESGNAGAMNTGSIILL